MSLREKLFGTHSQRELKRIMPIVDKVEALEDEYRKLTDDELKAKTPWLKSRLEAGETLDDILPDAVNVRYRAVLADIYAVIDAPAEMLREVSVYLAVDMTDPVIRIYHHSEILHDLSSFRVLRSA